MKTQTFDFKEFRRLNKLSQKDAAQYFDVSQSFISQIEKDARRVPPQYISKVREDNLYELPQLFFEDDLEFNDGVSVPCGRIIRYWQDIDATCGGTEIFTDCDSAKIINLQIPDFKDCTDAINIYGDSMYPQYKNGQIILLKKWEESYIEYGCAYLIVTTGGHRMVKQLRKAPDESNVICYSVNQEFEQFEIPKKDILSLWLVKGSIDKSNI